MEETFNINPTRNILIFPVFLLSRHLRHFFHYNKVSISALKLIILHFQWLLVFSFSWFISFLCGQVNYYSHRYYYEIRSSLKLKYSHIAACFSDLTVSSLSLISSFSSESGNDSFLPFPGYITQAKLRVRVLSPIFMELLDRGIEFRPLAFAPLRSRNRGDRGDTMPKLDSGERGGLWCLCSIIVKVQQSHHF